MRWINISGVWIAAARKNLWPNLCNFITAIHGTTRQQLGADSKTRQTVQKSSVSHIKGSDSHKAT